MPWKIKFTYDTGDSFRQEYGEVGFLTTIYDKDPWSEEYEWDDISLAQEALKRMREHYEWQDSLSTAYNDDLPQPKWWTGKFDPKYRYSGDWSSFNSPGNDGKDIRLYGGTYLGYFETLRGAEIVSTFPDDDKNRFSM